MTQVQLNKYETVCLIISVFCKSCEPMLCEPDVSGVSLKVSCKFLNNFRFTQHGFTTFTKHRKKHCRALEIFNVHGAHLRLSPDTAVATAMA